MSFDIYVQWFDNGEQASVSLEDILAVFGDAAVETDGWWHYVEDGEPVSHLHWDSEMLGPGRVGSININRPSGDGRLFDYLVPLMRLGMGVVYWPGTSHPIIADPAAIAHLPPSMIEGLGTTLEVSTGREILEELEKEE